MSQSARHFKTNFEFPSFKVWNLRVTATECRLWTFPLKWTEEQYDWKMELSYRAFTIQDSWSVCGERDYTFVFPFLSRTSIFGLFPFLITPQGSTSGLAFPGIGHLSLGCVLAGRLTQFKTLGPRAQASNYQIVYFPLYALFCIQI